MIVPSMTLEELVNEILSDKQIVIRKSLHLTEKLRREAIKTRNKKLYRFYEYKSKQKNNWLILIDYNSGDPLILSVVHYLNNFGLNAVSILSDKKTLVHYSAHFLERFNERFLKQENLSKLDVLKQFLPQNNIATYDFIPDSGEFKNRVFARFKDGIGLGIYEKLWNNKMIFLKTYISPEMIKKCQNKEYISITAAFQEHWNEFYKI
ncbi:MAG: hypothetical protein ACOXZO_04735 [Bacteroidales bacterium]|jgi:hypothetical protein